MTTARTDTYLGLGSNLGDRDANLRAALRLLERVGTVSDVAPCYETAPLYVTDQPAFLNTACRLTTSLQPTSLLDGLQEIERLVGRTPSWRYGPRAIDIDILLFGDLSISGPRLVIPHPLLAERAFALAPLTDIAPRALHPLLRKTIVELLREAPGRASVRRLTGTLALPADGGPA